MNRGSATGQGSATLDRVALGFGRIVTGELDGAVLVTDAASFPGSPGGERGTVSTLELGSDAALAATAFVLDPRRSGDVAEALRRIRQHPLPSVYLKPVILVEGGDAHAARVAAEVDLVWDAAAHPGRADPGAAAAVERLFQHAATFAPTTPEGDTRVALKLLRFMSTRGGAFEPTPTIHSRAGMVYPRLEPFLDGAAGEIAGVLASLEAQRLAAGRFVTKIHACSRCACAFLNFQEICPHCGSADLEADDVIHHFRCAYTGPTLDFRRRAGALVCPKCDRSLHQIGVDYDKPALMYRCNGCTHAFQEPEVTSTCYDCGRTASPEAQAERTLKSYRVTALGENAAVHGMENLFLNLLGSRSRLFDYENFRVVVDAEAARIGRYGVSRSSLLLVSLEGIESAYLELGERAKEIFEELTSTFLRIVRTSDFLTARSESLFVFLLVETGETDAERAAERLREGIAELLQNSLRHPPHLAVGIEPVGPELDLDRAVERFLGPDGR